MKLYTTVFSFIFSFLLISCNGGLDQTKVNSVEQEEIGKYFFKILKDGNKKEFAKWIRKPKSVYNYFGEERVYDRVEDYWNILNNYKGSPISWSTTEYNYTELSDYPSDHMRVFLNVTDRGNRPVLIFWLDKESDNKFYLDRGDPVVRTRTK